MFIVRACQKGAPKLRRSGMIAMNWPVNLDCGGKRSATPLSDRRKSGVALRLPPQSKSVRWQSLIIVMRDA